MLALTACAAPDDTRTKVSLVMGLRMDVDVQDSLIQEGILAVKAMNATEVLVEYPLRLTSPLDGRPLIDSQMVARFAAVVQQLHAAGLQVSLAVCNTHLQELFPHDNLNLPDPWLAGLEKLTDTLVLAMKPAKPVRIIVGKNLIVVEKATRSWAAFFTRLRQKHKVPVSYAVDIDRVTQTRHLLALGDEISIVYRPQGDGDVIAYCRQVNHVASQVADSLHKPVFIFQANILGDNPVQTFEYRLKFWSPDTKLNGITLNTLYPRFAIADTFIYYGLQPYPDFLQHLQDYQAGE